MKTENTIENRIKFGMLYYGQQVVKVIKGRYGTPAGTVLKVDAHYETHVRLDGVKRQIKTVLELTPVAQISDEDALNVANILGNCNHIGDESKIHQAKDLFSSPNFYNKVTNIPANKWRQVFRYLESKGYYLGDEDGTEVQHGWVKLKDV